MVSGQERGGSGHLSSMVAAPVCGLHGTADHIDAEPKGRGGCAGEPFLPHVPLPATVQPIRVPAYMPVKHASVDVSAHWVVVLAVVVTAR
jgi:hypothetical protein